MPSVEKINEETTKLRYITPAIMNSGWESHQIEMEKNITDGRIITLPGNKSKRDENTMLKADYVLYHNNKLLAVVEAKKYELSIGYGMQQATLYSDMLNAPFAFSSNGRGFLKKNMLTGEETEVPLGNFPTSSELWKEYKNEINLSDEEEEIIKENYYTKLNGKSPRYYQRTAIEKTVLSIAKGNKRNILVMATGTGKTYTAFQIIYRLWKSGMKKRILFLADRNILIDQTKSNDFSPFEGSMVKISRKLSMAELQAYEIHLGLYQQLKGQDGQEDLYSQYPKDFFDLIVIDECHRGSASEDSAWREILNYFDSATHLGLTATPKNNKEAHNFDYFGEPIYTYSLKQGINDGFLAPYKVIRVGLDKDIDGLSIKRDRLDDNGNILEAGYYEGKHFNKDIILTERDKVVAKIVTDYLKTRNRRMDKTIVFSQDIDSAERMRRALVNENLDLVSKNSNYIKRITGDSLEKNRDLDNFISLKSPYPTIVTTSKLMTTGVDAKTCKLIVIDQHINSMVEFKQIVGRGTRINEEFGKTHFDIIDFTNATRLFLDPEFDGKVEIEDIPVSLSGDQEIIIPTSEEEIVLPDIKEEEKEANIKYQFSDIKVKELFIEQKILDANGNLITEEYKVYIKNQINEKYSTYEDFLHEWCEKEIKKDILKELEEKGVYPELLTEMDENYNKYDLLDLLAMIVYNKKSPTKEERVERIYTSDFYYRYNDSQKKIINELLKIYLSKDIFNLEDPRILQKPVFGEIGSITEILSIFENANGYKKMLFELKQELYSR